MRINYNCECKDSLRIRVKYRNEWYNATSLSISNSGDIDFEYLDGYDGSIDSEHVQDYIISIVRSSLNLNKESKNE